MLVRTRNFKKMLPYAIVIFLCVGILFFAFAVDQSKAMAKQDEQKEMKHKEGMHEEMMEHKMMGMCPMHTMMGEHMMKKEVLLASDDSLIIVAAGKIYKYDKDLNLVKEVEFKGAEEMKEKMEKMHKECMEKCQGMMKDGMMKEKGK